MTEERDKIRFNSRFIEKCNGKVYLVSDNGRKYSRKEIVEILGIPERIQRDLVDANRSKTALERWSVGRFREMSGLLGVTIKELINAEDYERLEKEVHESMERVGTSHYPKKLR